MRTLDDMEHFEKGWMSIFNLLLCPKVGVLDMNGSGPFAEERSGPIIATRQVEFSLADLLLAFDPVPKHPKQLDVSSMKINDFFDRLAELKPEFGETMQAAYRKILNPGVTAQPSEVLPKIAVSLP
jgi:hypothetical protein